MAQASPWPWLNERPMPLQNFAGPARSPWKKIVWRRTSVANSRIESESRFDVLLQLCSQINVLYNIKVLKSVKAQCFAIRLKMTKFHFFEMNRNQVLSSLKGAETFCLLEIYLLVVFHVSKQQATTANEHTTIFWNKMPKSKLQTEDLQESMGVWLSPHTSIQCWHFVCRWWYDVSAFCRVSGKCGDSTFETRSM